MSGVTVFTSTGAKSTKTVTLDKAVFGLEVKNAELLKQAYQAYLAAGRNAQAKTLRRGEVSGGGRKPWRQKGTGRARAGSSRMPHWRGGGVTFGPTGSENYQIKLPTKARRVAIKQALSLKAKDGAVKIIETFNCPDGKVKPTVELLKKLEATRRVLIVVSKKDGLVERATRNIEGVKAVQASYLNVFDVMNSDHIIISRKALGMVADWLTDQTAEKPAKATKEKANA